MSKKKGEQVLQIEIDTAEQFDQVISKEGLVVFDVFCEWSGPMGFFDGVFQRMENDNPNFCMVHANCDKIPQLESYRGKCEPCFLFYASKELVAVVRGANAPVIIKTINEQLAQEHKVLKGEAQRKPIQDSVISKQQAKFDEVKNQKQVDKIQAEQDPITICIIKPDILAANKEEEVLEKIKEKGYKVVETKRITFTERMCQEFYAHKKDSPQFDDLVKYMTSGQSMVVVLSKEDSVVDSWRSDLGPLDLDEAKSSAPDSLRAQYATDSLMNSLHGSDSHESATKELAFFFPKGLGVKNASSRHTLALIRPSALAKYKDEILNKIKSNGFEIAMARQVQLDKQGAEDFYSEQRGKPFFDELVNEMTSGPLMVLCLVKDDAIASWRNMLGPKEKENIKNSTGTLRNEFDVSESAVNSLHGASTPEQVQKELSKFFPMEQTVAALKPNLSAEQKEEIINKIEKSGFLIASKKSEKLTEDIAKEMYKHSADKPYYQDLVNMMTQGETDILVLSRENAIDGWREYIGDTDPSKADPNSLRAIYGVDSLSNGVHGASNKSQVESELQLFFPGAKFNEEGEQIN